MKRLVEEGVVASGIICSGSWQWSYRGERPHATIGYRTNTVDMATPCLWLHYRVNNVRMDYRIALETTPPTFGGLRWWFLCPLSGRRAAKLYLPPDGRHFAHRAVYRLSYRSARKSGEFRSLFRALARDTGLSPTAARRILEDDWGV